MRRPRSSRRKNEPPPDAKPSDGSGGCLLVLFAILWYSGVISVEWLKDDQPAEQITNINVQLAQAQAQLAALTRISQQLRAETDTLDVRRTSLNEQVAQLEEVRDEIALSLTAASELVAPSGKSRWYARFEDLVSGLIGNLISAGLVGAIGWFYGRRSGLAAAAAKTEVQPEAPARER